MKLVIASSSIVLWLSSCGSTSVEPHSATAAHHAETSDAMLKDLEEREFRQDPTGWNTGSKKDLKYGGYDPLLRR
jgi:hypothetical protein